LDRGEKGIKRINKNNFTGMSTGFLLFGLAGTASAIQFTESIEYGNEYFDSLGDENNRLFLFYGSPEIPHFR